MIKITSWNINGLRAILKKDFFKKINKLNSDIICLQEIKIDNNRRQQAQIDFPNFVEFWHPANRPGYSGTGILIKENYKQLKQQIINYSTRFDGDGFDEEGRVQILEFKKFYLINAYFPHTRHDLSRLDFKLKFNQHIHKLCLKLDKSKPVIIAGDFNVAHQEIDLAKPKDNVHNPGFLPAERKWLDKFIASGFVDVFRYKYPKKQIYTWWSYRQRAREKDIGWRIDYFFVSQRFLNKIKNIEIHNDYYGSDHCPLSLKINI